MIASSFIEVIILFILMWCVGNKIIPQVILMFLTLFVGISEFNSGAEFQYMFFFAAVMIYGGLNIFYDKGDEE